MSGSVDDEVVRMRFDNNAFERGVATTLNTLSKLKSSLSFGSAGKSFDDLEKSANKFDLSQMNNQIDGSAHHWSAWRSAGLIAFATLVHQAVLSGERIVSAFTLDPVKAGFQNYETQINAVQTILANTGLKGASGLATVQKALDELNTYANQTVYNFSEMTKNIGTFTAAGVALAPATNAIKGIANLAALSGSSSEQASTAMYQLSQAIAANKVGLQDWNSVVNAGLGGKVFQQALFNTGKLEGTLKGVKANETFDQWTKAGNSFRNSLQKGWITGKVLTDTLSQFTGDLTDAQLKAMGYNAAQIKQIQELAKTALGAATNIKTFSQLTAALKEEVATAYAAIFKTIFGDINGATKLFTGLHNVLENALTTPIYALNKLLQGFVKIGGRAEVIFAISNAFKLLGKYVKTVKDAFREIFPPVTAKQLLNIVYGFERLQNALTPSKKTLNDLKRIFAGVFAIFDIGKQVIIQVAKVFGALFGDMTGGNGTVLDFIAHIADLIVAFDKSSKKSQLFVSAFQIILNVLRIGESIFRTFTSAIGELFKGFHPKDAKDVTNSVQGTANVLSKIAKITQNVADWFSKLPAKIKPGVDAVVHAFGRFGEMLAQGFNSQTFNNILKLLQTGLLAGIVVLLKRFLSNGLSVDVGGGFLGTFKEMIEGVTGNLKAMQQQLKAKALLEIAIAMGILAASLVALSMINPTKLQNSLKAMAIGFGELLAAMGILTKISGSAGFVKIPLMAASLDLLAVAILLLTAAVAAMSALSWQQIEKGLTAVGILLAALSIASYPLSANSAGMIQAGIGITAMAVAMNLLYVAVRAFASMSWDQMLKGLAGVGIALVGIAIAMRLMPKGMVLQSAALVLIAGAVNLLYLAVKDFSSLAWKTMIKGLVGVAGALTAIALAMKLMPPGMIAQSVALIAVGTALQLISKAVESMSKMSWSAIGKGLTTLAGSLTILAVALNVMTGTVGGAAALLIVAEGLKLFIPSLITLSTMKWSKILHGLEALAAAFAVIGVAGLLLDPVLPGLLGLGVALGLVGVAMLAFGAGASLLGVGLTAIAAAGGTAIGVLLSGLKSLIELLPTLANNLATALVNFITIIGQNSPQIVGAFVLLLTQLLQAVPKIMPSLIVALNSLIATILTVITTNAPAIIAAGFQLLMDLLTGIQNNIGQVVTTVTTIIVNFLNALATNLPQIIAAGVNLLFKFLEGVAAAAGQIPGEVVKIVGIFLASLFSNLPLIGDGGVKLVKRLVSGILSGLGDMGSAALSLMQRFISVLANWLGDVYNIGKQILGKIVSGIGDAIGSAISWVKEHVKAIGKAIYDGIIGGIGDLAGGIGGTIKGAIGSGLNIGKKALSVFGSPSPVFAEQIGKPLAWGIAQGIDDNAYRVHNSLDLLNKTSVLAMKKTMAGLADAIDRSNLDYQPTITPVMDLTEIQKGAAAISGLINTTPVSAVVSYDQARDISAYRQMVDDATADVNTRSTTPVPAVKFEQNNYSPKALSTAEIYRRTNNQMAQAKQLLGLPDLVIPQ